MGDLKIYHLNSEKRKLVECFAIFTHRTIDSILVEIERGILTFEEIRRILKELKET